MKCVKKNDDIKRVSDKYAEELVSKGWNYIPKKEWKIVRDSAKNKFVPTETTIPLVPEELAKKKIPGKKHKQEELKRSQK